MVGMCLRRYQTAKRTMPAMIRMPAAAAPIAAPAVAPVPMARLVKRSKGAMVYMKSCRGLLLGVRCDDEA